jgi:U3 small nucleolar RNA-associated protein 14
MNNQEGEQIETKTPQNTHNTGFSKIDNTKKDDPNPKGEGDGEEKKEEDKEFELPCDLYLKLFAGILGMLYGKDEPAKEDDAKKITKDDLQKLTDNSNLSQQEKDNIHKLYDTNHENAINGRNTEAGQQEGQERYNQFLRENSRVGQFMSESGQQEDPIPQMTNSSGTKFKTPQFNSNEAQQQENTI